MNFPHRIVTISDLNEPEDSPLKLLSVTTEPPITEFTEMEVPLLWEETRDLLLQLPDPQC